MFFLKRNSIVFVDFCLIIIFIIMEIIIIVIIIILFYVTLPYAKLDLQ